MKLNINKSFRMHVIQYKLPKMQRFQTHRKKVALKLLLSKIIYTQENEILRLKRIIVAASSTTKEKEVSALTFVTRFARTPSFSETQNRRNKSYALNARVLQSQKASIDFVLHTLLNVLAPFQLENDLFVVKNNTKNEINWTRRKFRPPTQLYALFYQYNTLDDPFDITVNALFNKGTTANFIFYMRMFQTPIILKESAI